MGISGEIMGNSKKGGHESAQICCDYFLSMLQNRIAHIANMSISKNICELVK